MNLRTAPESTYFEINGEDFSLPMIEVGLRKSGAPLTALLRIDYNLLSDIYQVWALWGDNNE